MKRSVILKSPQITFFAFTFVTVFFIILTVYFLNLSLSLHDVNYQREDLTIHGSIPVDMPAIEMDKNVFETDAFTLINQERLGRVQPHIIYVKSSVRDAYKLLMFMNMNAWNALGMRDSGKVIFNIVAFNDSTAQLATLVLSCLEDVDSKVKSSDKKNFIRTGIDAWKVDEPLLFCILMNENDKEMKRLAKIMNTWSVQVYDYLKNIDAQDILSLVPYARISGFYMKSFLNEKKELDFIYSVLIFETLVYVEKDGNIMQARKHIRAGIIKNLQSFYQMTSLEPENDMNAIAKYERMKSKKIIR